MSSLDSLLEFKIQGKYHTICTSVEVSSANVEEALVLVEAFLLTRQDNKAKELVDHITVARGDSNTSLHDLVLAKYHQFRGNYKEAWGILNKEPDLPLRFVPEWLSTKVEVLVKKAQFDNAREEAKKALAMDGMSGYYRGELLLSLGTAELSLGELESSIERFREGLTLFEGLQNNYQTAQALNSLGRVYFYQGELEKAEETFLSAVRFFDHSDVQAGKSGTYGNLGILYYTQGMIGKAEKYYSHMITIFRSMKDKTLIARGLNNLVAVYAIRGQYKRAIELMNEAVDLASGEQNPEVMAYLYHNLGSLHGAVGEKELAKKNLYNSLSIFEEIGNPLDITQTIYNLTLLGDYTENLLSKIPSPPYDSPVTQAFKDMTFGLVAVEQKEWQEAEKLFEQAVAVPGLEYDFKLECLEELAMIALLWWKDKPEWALFQKAKARLDNYEELCRLNRLTAHLCQVYLIRARLHQTLLQQSEAEKLIQNALLQAEEVGLPLHQAHAQEQLAWVQEQTRLLGTEGSLVEEKSVDDAVSYIKNLSNIISQYE